jgi:phospholipase/carboxylesterase
MTANLSGPMVVPKSGGAPKQAVVLLHGYGSDGQDLIGLAGSWRDILPNALFVSPNAPYPCADIPGGRYWVPVTQGPRGRAVDGAPSAGPVLVGFLADLWRQTGVGPEATILAGFSQGAMMSVQVGLGLDPAPMGIISFSGALVAPDSIGHAAPKPPVCLIHGDRDQVVDPGLSAAAAKLLRERGYAVHYHVEPGAGHTISPDGLAFASAFIASLLPVR